MNLPVQFYSFCVTVIVTQGNTAVNGFGFLGLGLFHFSCSEIHVTKNIENTGTYIMSCTLMMNGCLVSSSGYFTMRKSY